jgi:hypothetical protein
VDAGRRRAPLGRRIALALADAAGAISYAGLTILAAGAALTRRRFLQRALCAWVAGVTLVAGVLQRQLWPLSSWSLMVGTPTRERGTPAQPFLRMLAVDSAGAEYAVDYRAVEPFAIEELMAWMRNSFMTLAPAQRDSAAAYLLGRLEVARLRVLLGRSPGTQGHWLGPLRAPFHTLHPRVWRSSADVPTAPFSALRLYAESWDVVAREVDVTSGTRTLLYEYRVGVR